MTKVPEGPVDGEPSERDAQPPPSVRAQLLATEHWSLLASRSTTQNEVLTRINMFLTLVSAGLVSLALVGQATGFSDAFGAFSITVLGIISMVGVLTQVRVVNVAMEDLMYVLAMNRLRAAYTDLDPGIAQYLMTSRYDDMAGVTSTYYFLGKRSGLSQVSGSSMVFIIAVNTALIGLFASAVLGALGASTPLVIIAGALSGVVYLGVSIALGGRRFHRFWRTHTPLYPSPAP